MMMKMYLHFGSREPYILFFHFTTHNAGEMFGSCILFAVLTILYELVKAARHSIGARYECNCPAPDVCSTSGKHAGHANSCHSKQTACSTDGKHTSTALVTDSPDQAEYCVCKKKVGFRSAFNRVHVCQTLIYVLQMILAYALMLIVMCYNVWVCLSVVIGHGIGYFLIAWKFPSSPSASNDGCH